MYTDLDRKIDNLSKEKKLYLYSELRTRLSDRFSAAKYGIVGHDYDILPLDKVEKAKEKLYHELFETSKRKYKNKSN